MNKILRSTRAKVNKVFNIIRTCSEGMGLECVGKSSALPPNHDQDDGITDDYYQGREQKRRESDQRDVHLKNNNNNMT